MKLSVRNVLKGKVKELRHGQVMTEVVVVTDGGTEVVSV
ncbi:MAG: TOBE domain-containing protein, partial [Desulfobacteraceae bacterium]|nr:TOBE domain-containing protein [Desulfobacteraceae bacterium]